MSVAGHSRRSDCGPATLSRTTDIAGTVRLVRFVPGGDLGVRVAFELRRDVRSFIREVSLATRTLPTRNAPRCRPFPKPLFACIPDPAVSRCISPRMHHTSSDGHWRKDVRFSTNSPNSLPRDALFSGIAGRSVTWSSGAIAARSIEPDHTTMCAIVATCGEQPWRTPLPHWSRIACSPPYHEGKPP
jgi:hypothetical protein